MHRNTSPYIYLRKSVLVGDCFMVDRLKWLGILLVLIFVLYGMRKVESIVTEGDVKGEDVDVIIDAGHGGNDPGKVGVNDVLEKDINLQIAKKLREELEARGIKVLMTREEDQGLYDENSDNKKVQDLTRRVELINEVKPALTVSIHQNSYPSPDVSGSQIFYYEHSSEGEKIARVMQSKIENLEGLKNRPVKGNTTYFLLKRTEVPTLIVECGFLSNQAEAQKLTEEDYQNVLVEVMADGIEECLS